MKEFNSKEFLEILDGLLSIYDEYRYSYEDSNFIGLIKLLRENSSFHKEKVSTLLELVVKINQLKDEIKSLLEKQNSLENERDKIFQQLMRDL